MKITEEQSSKLDLTNNSYFGRLGQKDIEFIGLEGNHHGLLTDHNIWNRSLSTKEMIDWTTCG